MMIGVAIVWEDWPTSGLALAICGGLLSLEGCHLAPELGSLLSTLPHMLVGILLEGAHQALLPLAPGLGPLRGLVLA